MVREKTPVRKGPPRRHFLLQSDTAFKYVEVDAVTTTRKGRSNPVKKLRIITHYGNRKQSTILLDRALLVKLIGELED